MRINQNTAKIEAEFQIAVISSWDELFSKGEHQCPGQRGPKTDCVPFKCTNGLIDWRFKEDCNTGRPLLPSWDSSALCSEDMLTPAQEPTHLNCKLIRSLYQVLYFKTHLLPRNTRKTAVHCWNPALSVLVILVSRNVFHVVLASQSIVCHYTFWLIRSLIIYIIIHSKYFPVFGMLKSHA